MNSEQDCSQSRILYTECTIFYEFYMYDAQFNITEGAYAYPFLLTYLC